MAFTGASEQVQKQVKHNLSTLAAAGMNCFVATRAHGGGSVIVHAVDTDSQARNKEQWLKENTDGVLLVSPCGDPMGKPFRFPRLKKGAIRKATNGAYQLPPMVQAATPMSNAKQGARQTGAKIDVLPFLHEDWAKEDDAFTTAHITHDAVCGSTQDAAAAMVKSTTTVMSRHAGGKAVEVTASDGGVTGSATEFQQRMATVSILIAEREVRHAIIVTTQLMLWNTHKLRLMGNP